MRSSKGFVLQPIQGPATNSSSGTRPPPGRNLPSSAKFDYDRLAFLEEEIAQLKLQLKDANQLIAKLREENKDLSEQISASPNKRLTNRPSNSSLPLASSKT